MVIRGGANAYAREIEGFSTPTPASRISKSSGCRTPKYGEEPCAWIVPKRVAVLDTEGFLAFCKGRIAHHKVPRYVRMVKGFPTTVTRKV
jgi:fatty-acyl-CoA synthase